MDLSNPPLETVDTSAKEAPKAAEKAADPDLDPDPFCGYGGNRCKPDPSVDLTYAGLKVPPGVITMSPGQEVELDEISTQRILCLELRYFCGSYIDYNIMAYDAGGNHLWNSTYANAEIKNKDGAKCCIHCRDICANPSPTEPALRTLHVDLEALDDNVLSLMITSQIFSGVRPEAVSIAIREADHVKMKDLVGNHQPLECKGRLLLAQDISAPLKQGGTTVYACLYRDPSDPQSFNFRNTLGGLPRRRLST